MRSIRGEGYASAAEAPPRPPMTADQRNFARSLRRRQTSFEEALWHQLRARRLLGFKFRRQVPLQQYVVDFLCLEAKLIVEVDGHQHNAQAEYDARRSHDLECMGFCVLRFSNDQVRDRLDDVVKQVAAALRQL